MIQKTNINGQPYTIELQVIVDQNGNTNHKILLEADREWRDTAKEFQKPTTKPLRLIKGGKNDTERD